ncbi:hypothetical protein NDU88_005221 [Pleurodeles waltl]|uniref:Uncharacterized protein n=1 Tax=Pleurodeles waltl TaxID=8319 RepID=A0AAV7L1R1_PLEWA|nr:hypothetical protein NDU88_005221 [Pleurodeles waltl]
MRRRDPLREPLSLCWRLQKWSGGREARPSKNHSTQGAAASIFPDARIGTPSRGPDGEVSVRRREGPTLGEQ